MPVRADQGQIDKRLIKINAPAFAAPDRDQNSDLQWQMDRSLHSLSGLLCPASEEDPDQVRAARKQGVDIFRRRLR